MARKDIYKLTKNTVIHCPTINDSYDVRLIFDEYGLKWRDGGSYISVSNWNNYKHETCYNPIEGTFCYLDYYKRNKFKIISAAEFIELIKK